MFIYTLVVIVVIALSSALLIYILRKNNMFSLDILLSIIISSITACFLFPLIYGFMSDVGGFYIGQVGILLPILTALIIYVTLILLLSVVVSLIFTEEKLKNFFQNARELVVEKGIKRFGKLFSKPVEPVENNTAENNIDVKPAEDADLVQKEAEIPEKEMEMPEIEQYPTEAENIFEKSVDTGQNIDKMGLVEINKTDNGPPEDDSGREQIPADQVDVQGEALQKADFVEVEEKSERMGINMKLGIDECIEEAFKLKQNMDIEGAILYYMYALDQEPDRDLVFWIILDICALYKSLGKADLAREILESYSYSDVMDESVITEIERNLSYS